jgi:glycosyltransferase involved in cell wall biosynthesis
MAERPARPPVALLVDQFLALSETFVAAEAHALRRLGFDLRIVATVRAVHHNPDDADGLDVAYREDDAYGRKLVDLIRLCLRHPVGCLRDLVERRRWANEEPVGRLAALAPTVRRLERERVRHLHVHFAVGAALDTMRIARLIGVPYSVTAHAYDIFQTPANLAEKLERAAFVTTGCEYNVDRLRDLVPAAADHTHKIVMGIDGERFRRVAPHPGGRSVIAIGRLVEKKGFGDLIDAVARLASRDALESATIIGEGPLRQDLERAIAANGLADVVELVGARPPDHVRAALERVDLLALPCVIAADGDRDSMPVVVKEALAMEIPVVVTDEVGLPEVVRDEWGRLVPPHDPERLAEAIAEVLALDPEERARMGRAGRAFVLRECDVDRETEKLARLIEAAALS